MNGILLEVRNLTVRYPIWGGILRHKVNEVRAVDNVSFTLRKGETLGLVGESGCGKTTVAKAICHLLRATVPGVVIEGQILFHTEQGTVDLMELGRRDMRGYRAEIQMIFQDPFSSLNPRMTVREIVERPLVVHTKMTSNQRRERVHNLLERVGLQPEYATRYPHEFSGGQRQRVGIARALAARPQLIVADEPVSALDGSVRSFHDVLHQQGTPTTFVGDFLGSLLCDPTDFQWRSVTMIRQCTRTDTTHATNRD